MQQERILSQLLALAEQLGLEVREEKGDFNGGWCTLDGVKLIFLNRGHSTAGKVAVLAEALAYQSLEGVYVLPAVRDLLEEYRNQDKLEDIR